MPPRRRAFTLVELLVVIGIITVLVALLLPALGRAREHANRVKCAANLRSMGQALTMYTQQYRHYPGTWFLSILSSTPNSTVVDYAAAWPVRLRPFVGPSKEVFFCPSRDERCRWTDDGPRPLQRAAGRYVALGYDPGEPLLHFFAPFSYAYNGSAGEGAQGHEPPQKGLGLVAGGIPDAQVAVGGWQPELPASRVRVPAEMIAVADSDADGKGDFYMIPNQSHGVGSPYLQPGRVHAGGPNVLFCDGHVTWYRQEDLLVDDSRRLTDPSQAPRYRMWRNDHRAPMHGG